MMTLFNAQQGAVQLNGGKVFYVTLQEVRTHFCFHDMCNPMRQVGERLQMQREIMRKGVGYIYGTVNGKRYWNKPNTNAMVK